MGQRVLFECQSFISWFFPKEVFVVAIEVMESQPFETVCADACKECGRQSSKVECVFISSEETADT